MGLGRSVKQIAAKLDSARMAGVAIFGGKDEILRGDGADDSKVVDVNKEEFF